MPVPDKSLLRLIRSGSTYASRLKRLLIGSGLRRGALAARDLVELVTSKKEALGTKANDQLANLFIGRLCRPGRTYVDVGAHIGSTLAEALQGCPRVNIIAVEAIPEKAEQLRANFPMATVLNFAISETEGTVSFFVDETHSGGSSLARIGEQTREIKVPAARLDQLVDHDDVDFIKIDVEGAELGVVRGAEELVARCRPTIMFESGPLNVLGYGKQAMFEWFAERDYGIFLPNRLPHGGAPMTLELFLDAHEYPFRTLNYFAVPLEKLDEVRGRLSGS